MIFIKQDIRKIADWLWEIPPSGGMRVPARIYASEKMLETILGDESVQQTVNVAHLPGIVSYSLAMPDIHQGYGFPIGGVAATDPENGGVISPGGIGYDINCGIRLVRTNLEAKDCRKFLDRLANRLFQTVPSGVGSAKAIDVLTRKDLDLVSRGGSRWAVERGYGVPEDIERTESEGCLQIADPDTVSAQAVARGVGQMGTLGSGNHFLEIDIVEEVFDSAAAARFGLDKGCLAMQIHCGSRGYGHQICSDYLRVMQRAVKRYGINLPDRQLACAPLNSPEGRQYLAAMACAANFAWANRQTIMHMALEIFTSVLRTTRAAIGADLVYDVCHNIAKVERHRVDGVSRELCVHRKGATRAFPEGHPDLPEIYRETGQPVLIPGDMGRESYVLAGMPSGMEQTFGSSCHGAGRIMSRSASLKATHGRDLFAELKAKDIIVKAKGRRTLGEEMSDAYKNITEVVGIMHDAGIARKVARLRPVAVIKG